MIYAVMKSVQTLAKTTKKLCRVYTRFTTSQ